MDRVIFGGAVVVFYAAGCSWEVVTILLSGVAICVVLSDEMALVILLPKGSKVPCLLGCHPKFPLELSDSASNISFVLGYMVLICWP